jgi:amino acid transporter
MNERMQKILVAIIVVVAVLFLLAAGAFVAWRVQDIANRGPELMLPILIIFGVVVLLVVLALTAVVYASMNISDKTQALALPEGSVRAVLALSLVVLFAIVSIFLYSNLSSNGKIETVSGLSSEARDEFKKGLPSAQILLEQNAGVADKPSYTIYYRQVLNPASEDFAKQLLVLIGTLVTSVASFYFGAKTATSAQAGMLDATRPTIGAPSLRALNPSKIVRGAPAVTLEITGDNLDLVKEVKVASGSQQVLATGVMSNTSSIKCQLAVDQNAPAGAWDVIVTDGAGRQAKLASGLNVS